MKSVTHCLFIEEHDIFVTAVYDRSNKTSTLEVSCFLKTGFIQDKFRLITNRDQTESGKSSFFAAERGVSRPSLVDAMSDKKPGY